MIRRATARPCPLCQARSGRPIWREAGLDYVRCAGCGLVFSDVTEADYERLRHNVWDEPEPGPDALAFYGAARTRVHEQFLDRHPPRGGGRLLDVGAGLGFFLERAAARGWTASGIDSSPAWVAEANARLGAERVLRGTLADAPWPPQTFDLITAWDVIEHIHDPVSFLGEMRRLLAPQGRIFLRTPNVAYVWPVYRARRSLLGHEVVLGPLNHVVLFSARTLRAALGQAGLRPVDWSVYDPPQVGPAAVKNRYAAAADRMATATGGMIVLGSDLDLEGAVAHPTDR